MNAIPAAVESALLDAGFSSTEVLVLQRLMEHEALTLRELAGRTAKSTGVLDLAVKKLLQKGIIRKQFINAHVKLSLVSLEAILQWMENDTKHKRELMARRHQNFETFIRSLEQDRKRPEIKFFDGLEGIAKAYRMLLDCGKKEMLGYVPVFCAIEDHPLRDFLVEWFRQRRKRGIFSRIIAHDTPLGRRHQSRDIFEYRQSILIPEAQYPFTFEKYVCGETVACFNYVEKRACLLLYPELAAMERGLFEGIWREHAKKDAATPIQLSVDGGSLVATPPSVASDPSFRIRTFSGLREFFVSRKSIAAFCAFAALAAVITVSLYTYTKELQFRQMQETVKSIAATGAFQFDPKDLDALQVEKDWRKEEWGRVVNMLERIRTANKDVEFVYILRRKPNPRRIEFIADSHSIDPNAEIDLNHDGVIDDADKLQWPGQEYRDASDEAFRAFDEKAPIVSETAYQDQWGVLISGYAQIRNPEGAVVGVLAVDMKAEVLNERTASIFQPLLYFIGLFLLFVLMRLAAFNRSLLIEFWRISKAGEQCAFVCRFLKLSLLRFKSKRRLLYPQY